MLIEKLQAEIREAARAYHLDVKFVGQQVLFEGPGGRQFHAPLSDFDGRADQVVEDISDDLHRLPDGSPRE